MRALRFNKSDPFVQDYLKEKEAEDYANDLLHGKTHPKEQLYAKGRMKEGSMNKTEKLFQEYLEAQKQAGKILAYWFESIKVKIAEGTCWYTPDFMVLRPNGEMELHEVKGSPAIFFDDAKVKVKSCATQFPFRMFVVFPRSKKDGGGWDFTEY